MELSTIITFLTGGSAVAVLLTQILKGALGKVSERWGALATQAILLVVALFISAIITASTLVPENYLLIAGGIFTGAITIYEVLVKAVWNNAVKGNV